MMATLAFTMKAKLMLRKAYIRSSRKCVYNTTNMPIYYYLALKNLRLPNELEGNL